VDLVSPPAFVVPSLETFEFFVELLELLVEDVGDVVAGE
jgi:hypothetical protein